MIFYEKELAQQWTKNQKKITTNYVKQHAYNVDDKPNGSMQTVHRHIEKSKNYTFFRCDFFFVEIFSIEKICHSGAFSDKKNACVVAVAHCVCIWNENNERKTTTKIALQVRLHLSDGYAQKREKTEKCSHLCQYPCHCWFLQKKNENQLNISSDNWI